MPKSRNNYFLISGGLLLFITLRETVHAQLFVDDTRTPQQLVQNTLLGNGVIATGITYTGSDSTIGFFDAHLTNLGLDSGIIMTTGSIQVARGPNNSSGATGGDIFGIGLAGDDDLTLLSGEQTYDATVLEFDFVPQSDTMKFRYVFGSEEYMEYVGLSFNDVFGFFVSGPGISGPYSNGAKNIALIPGTNTPVSIDSVNANVNSDYWFDNGDGDTITTPGDDGLTIQYDGFTKALTAKLKVQCGQTYHIKLAVADGGDNVLDSGVFLEAGSFESGGVLSVINASANKDTICPFEDVVISTSGNFKTNAVYSWSFEGASVVSGTGQGPFDLQWDKPGNKKIKLIVNPNSLCGSASDSVNVNIADCTVKPTNIFTPNQDKHNDNFTFIFANKNPGCHLIVYNRWGNKVYEDASYRNTWDGDNLPDGVYYYTLDVPHQNSQMGFVYLIRN